MLAPMGLRLSPEKTRVVHIDDGFDFLGFHIRRMRKRGSGKLFVYTRPSNKAIASIKDRVRTMTYRHTLHHDPGYLLDYLGRVLRGWANYFRHGVVQSHLQRGRLLRLGADHVLAATQTPDRMARTATQVLPARHLAARPRRATVPWRRHRHGDPVPLPRLPDPDPVDPQPEAVTG